MLILATVLSVIPIPPEARHDADCLQAASWALSWMGTRPHDEAVENVQYVSYYYLGRLTARNNDVDWFMSLSHDMNSRPRLPEQVSSDRLLACTDEMTDHNLTAPVRRALTRLPPDHH